MKKIFNVILIGILIICFAYLFNNRFFINYELSALKAEIFKIESILSK